MDLVGRIARLCFIILYSNVFWAILWHSEVPSYVDILIQILRAFFPGKVRLSYDFGTPRWLVQSSSCDLSSVCICMLSPVLHLFIK